MTGETGLGEMGTDVPCRRPCALQTLSTQEDRRRGGDWAAGSCGQALHARAQSRQRCYARGGRDSMVSRPKASVAAPQPPRRVVTQRGREATEAVVRRSFVDSEAAGHGAAPDGRWRRTQPTPVDLMPKGRRAGTRACGSARGGLGLDRPV